MPRPPRGTGYQDADARWEINQAAEMGLDGFWVNSMTTPSTTAHNILGGRLTAQASASFPGFFIAPMVDATALNGTAPTAISDVINLYDNNVSSYYHSDGRLMVGMFAPEAVPLSWRQAIADDYRVRYNKTIAWVGCFLDAGNFNAYRSILYGAGQWGEMGDLASELATPAYVEPIKNDGKKLLYSCWPSSYRPRTGWYDEQVNTQSMLAWWNRIIVDQADMVQLTTWNDFTEESGFVETPTQGRTVQDISAYYLVKWKTGLYPVVIRDCIYLSHPTRTYNAAILSPNQTHFMSKRPSSTRASTCYVEALTSLTAPATVTISVAGTLTDFSAPADVSAYNIPVTSAVAVGSVSAKAVRNNITVAAVTSTAAIRSNAWNDDHQYMLFSSLRGTAGQFDPTPNNNGAVPPYPQ